MNGEQTPAGGDTGLAENAPDSRVLWLRFIAIILMAILVTQLIIVQKVFANERALSSLADASPVGSLSSTEVTISPSAGYIAEVAEKARDAAQNAGDTAERARIAASEAAAAANDAKSEASDCAKSYQIRY